MIRACSEMRRYMVEVGGAIMLLVVATYSITFLVDSPEVVHLPSYTLSTVVRILITLLISIGWGVPFGILAATNKTASLVITPIIDLLQSIPILGYFPLVLGFLFAIGPFGVELSIIVLLFTSMAWSIFFGVVGAVRSIPPNIVEASRSFGLTGWQFTKHVVLPAITPALISGANLAWSDGWFFMIAAEYIQYKGDIVVPRSGGLGYLLARAAYFYKDLNLAVILLLYISAIVLVINYFTWQRLMERARPGFFRPVISMGLSGVGQLGTSRRTSWLRRAQGSKALSILAQRLVKYSRLEKSIASIIVLASIMMILSSQMHHIPTPEKILEGLREPPAEELVNLPTLIALTVGRLTMAYVISLAVAISLGVLAAENRKMASLINVAYSIGQGVPILALFPVIFLWLSRLLGGQRLALEITCIVMLVLDMIWYMFINITNAIRNIPPEIKEVGRLFGFRGIHRIAHLIIPSILPSIVTGSILSWGTGWNTIIFAEYLPSTDPTIPPESIPGIGSLLDKAGYLYGNNVVLLAIIIIIAIIVLSMEGLVWRRLIRRFEKYNVEV